MIFRPSEGKIRICTTPKTNQAGQKAGQVRRRGDWEGRKSGEAAPMSRSLARARPSQIGKFFAASMAPDSLKVPIGKHADQNVGHWLPPAGILQLARNAPIIRAERLVLRPTLADRPTARIAALLPYPPRSSRHFHTRNARFAPPEEQTLKNGKEKNSFKFPLSHFSIASRQKSSVCSLIYQPAPPRRRLSASSCRPIASTNAG